VLRLGVLSRGLLSGHVQADTFAGKQDFRAFAPRFTGENGAANLKLVAALGAVAERLNATPAQAAIAWALHKGEDIIPLVGARRRDRLSEALGARTLTLSPEDIANLEAAVPVTAVAGARYDDHGMAMLDSEQG
jgi:aryl-alcohol dehydrogenase-like predicted oxidoreductase